MKYYIVPFGCQMNRSDTERIHSILEDMGYVEGESENDPDIVLKGIIACSVRQKAIDRVYGKIRNWNKSKKEKPLITFVSGCILPSDKKKFLTMFDLVFPIEQLTELPDMIRQYGVPSPPSVGIQLEQKTETQEISPTQSQHPIENFWQIKPRYSSPVEAWIPIQNGCDKFCSFCAVPYTRGREISRSSADVLNELRSLVENGCRSISLLGQNVNSYGLDQLGKELSFPELMREVGEIGRSSGKDFWVYFTSPHPRDFTTELLEVMAEYPVLAKWVHLPLQSGSDEVLKKMNRNHSISRYREIVDDIRRIIPESALFTDIIVGFTGESEQQFQKTVEAMKEFRYDMAYVAQYSPRPGAQSSRWIDDVSREEKERRFRILSDVMVEITEPMNQSKIGKIERVLITGRERKPGYLSGHTEGRIPVRIRDDNIKIGEILPVRITSARKLSIEGVME